tara:strand:- start:575 stop:736 length:162 start_codon:yes stop_codon:yes gene_type:complete
LDLDDLALKMAAGEGKQKQRAAAADDTAEGHEQPSGASVGSCGVDLLRALERP